MATEVINDPALERLLERTRAVELVAEDGEPMESFWHLLCIHLLIQAVEFHLRGRDDFFAAGNQFIYFDLERARNRNFRGPDFYVVLGVPHEPMREYWCVWQEDGRYPDVIIELLSPSTAEVDRTTKKDIYERSFHTTNYFCYDPETKTVEGWELVGGHYQDLQPNEHGRLWCSQLGLWVGPWVGTFARRQETWVRFYDNDGRVVPTQEEAEQQRADAMQAEVARLQARIAELEGRPNQQ